MINLEKKVVTAKKEKLGLMKTLGNGTKRLVKFTLGAIVVVSILVHETNQDSHITKMNEQTMNEIKKAKELNYTFTVTGEKSEDGYLQTKSVTGEEIYLSDVEMNLAKLHKGDKVQILTNGFGEVITIKKLDGNVKTMANKVKDK